MQEQITIKEVTAHLVCADDNLPHRPVGRSPIRGIEYLERAAPKTYSEQQGDFQMQRWGPALHLLVGMDC